MNDTTDSAGAPIPFVALDLSEQNLAVFDAIADALECDLNDVAHGFMLATPKARNAAALLWQAHMEESARHKAILAQTPSLADRVIQATISRAAQSNQLRTLRRLIGLAPDFAPHILVEAGLRYLPAAKDATPATNVA